MGKILRLEADLRSAHQELTQVKNDRDKYRMKYQLCKAESKSTQKEKSRFTEYVQLFVELRKRYKKLLKRRERDIEELSGQVEFLSGGSEFVM